MNEKLGWLFIIIIQSVTRVQSARREEFIHGANE